MKIYNFYLISIITLSISLLSTSCNTAKKTTEIITEEKTPDGAGAFILAAAQHQFQAEWLTGNAQLSYNDGNMAVGATATIKMKKDEVIWMNVKKFGFELGRAKVTEDSIYILDRFNKQFTVKPISYIADKFGLPANLSMLQQIFLGNPVYLTTNNPKGSSIDNIYHLSATSDNTRNDYWFSMPGYTMERMDFTQEKENRSLGIKLEDYKDAGGNRDFSYLRKISVDSKETGEAQIEIKFSKIEIDVPTEIKFSIPAHYTKMAY